MCELQGYTKKLLHKKVNTTQTKALCASGDQTYIERKALFNALIFVFKILPLVAIFLQY